MAASEGYRTGMTLRNLPADLPPGRLLTPGGAWGGNGAWTDGPVCWVSDQPVDDLPGKWARLQAACELTGLRPIALEYVDDELLPERLSDIEAVDVENYLIDSWKAYCAYREAARVTPVSYDEVPEGVEVPDDPGPPYSVWPGLASADLLHADPDLVACEVVATEIFSDPGFATPHVALVPAPRSADIPALMGWYFDGPRPAALAAVLRSWEDRFGVRVIAACHGGWKVSVAAPPTTKEQAEHLALEHLLVCPDALYQVGAWTFPEYAERILGSRIWHLWWD
ncbi:hypothetical protein Msi02_62120 [Microbispora siamensis]|uniref:DUF4253 domain-containing protein n=2 Tax=Microbispora siamensis TaxID=564413 RepID=A0ABQ4GVJ1_9ACTN|nr:hypothetical protein Msi02_62120 [Microbispora siamensis]